MKTKKFIKIFFLSLLFNLRAQNNDPIIYDLKSEYLVNPIGLDNKKPRLSWKIKDSRRGAIQKSYEISVGTDSVKVALGKGSHWNTGKIDKDKQLVIYNGNKLEAYHKYYWSVKVWGIDNKEIRANYIASFEMGMIDIKNWKGSWISDSRDTVSYTHLRAHET